MSAVTTHGLITTCQILLQPVRFLLQHCCWPSTMDCISPLVFTLRLTYFNVFFFYATISFCRIIATCEYPLHSNDRNGRYILVHIYTFMPLMIIGLHHLLYLKNDCYNKFSSVTALLIRDSAHGIGFYEHKTKQTYNTDIEEKICNTHIYTKHKLTEKKNRTVHTIVRMYQANFQLIALLNYQIYF